MTLYASVLLSHMLGSCLNCIEYAHWKGIGAEKVPSFPGGTWIVFKCFPLNLYSNAVLRRQD